MSNIQVTLKTAKSLVAACLRSNLVPLVKGSPGMGKSAIIHEIAREKGLKVIDLRLSQCDVVDLLGFPMIGTSGKAGYQPMDTFPLATDTVPVGFNGWLLFLDEITSAPPSIQAASYKLVLDRMVGQHPLHAQCYIVSAGNLETDNAVVEPMSTALQSRLVHIEVKVDAQEWLEWANKKQFDVRITSYINWKKEAGLFNFNPNHTECTFACSRTWEFTNRLIANLSEKDKTMLPLLSGTLGEGTAREFIAFAKIYEALPRIEDILAKPETHHVPSEVSIQYALTGALAAVTTAENLDKVVIYLERMNAEMQMITFKSIILRGGITLSKNPVFRKWTAKFADMINEEV